jgi:uncharacterized protein YbjT (DUF2867 family)
MVWTTVVTGATGTVLSSTGQKVRAAVHSATRVTSNDKLKEVELIEMEYNKPETLVTAFKGADKLFLLTPASPKAAELTSNLVTEAKKAGIRHIVRQSIMGADIEVNVAHLDCIARQKKL